MKQGQRRSNRGALLLSVSLSPTGRCEAAWQVKNADELFKHMQHMSSVAQECASFLRGTIRKSQYIVVAPLKRAARLISPDERTGFSHLSILTLSSRDNLYWALEKIYFRLVILFYTFRRCFKSLSGNYWTEQANNLHCDVKNDFLPLWNAFCFLCVYGYTKGYGKKSTSVCAFCIKGNLILHSPNHQLSWSKWFTWLS